MRRRLFATVAGLLGLYLSTCQISAPEAPVYQVPLKLVLTDTMYTLTDLSDDTDHIVINGNSQPEFIVNGNPDTFYVKDQLAVQAESFNQQIEMEDYLTINTTMRDSSIRLWDVIPGIEQFEETYQPIPRFSINQMRTNSFTVGKINYIKINSGIAEIKIENYLPISIDSIKVRLLDEIYGFVEEMQFDFPLTPGSSRTASVDLAGKSVSSELFLEISAVSPGSGNDNVYITNNSYIVASMIVHDLQLIEAEAYVSSVMYEDEVELTVIDDMHISEARFLSGKANLELTNHTGMEANISMQFPDIFRADGNLLTLDFILTIKQKLQTSINLKDLIFKPPVDEGMTGQKLRVHFLVTTFDYGKEIVRLTRQDWAEVDIALENMKFAYISGILNREEMNIDSEISFTALSDNFNEIRFNKARLDLNFYNRINFPIYTEFELISVSKTGNRVMLPIQQRIEPGSFANQTKTTVMLTQSNSDILNFLSNLPQKIDVQGKAYVGDGITTGSIDYRDLIEVDYKLTTPLQAAFSENIVSLDTTEIIIEPEDYDGEIESDEEILDGGLMKRISSGEMKFSVYNHFPVGVGVEIFITDNLNQLIQNPQLKIGPIEMLAGKIDNSGQVFEASKKVNQVQLSENDLNIFTNNTDHLKRLFIYTRLHLHGTEGKMVAVSVDDFVTISGISEFKFEISKFD